MQNFVLNPRGDVFFLFGRRMAVVASMLLAASCGERGALYFMPEGVPPGEIEKVIVATPRVPYTDWRGFSNQIAEQVNFALYDVSVPPIRAEGTVTYPDDAPDPQTDFLVSSITPLGGESDFIRAINDTFRSLAADQKDANLFIHGFNNNFAESLFRYTQITHDMGRPGAHIAFSWPSVGSPAGYAADKERALRSRTTLTDTIDAMARSNADNINLTAHSMGGFLLMETLHDMALSGHDAAFAKMDTILLLSPDVDVALFRELAPPVLARGVDIYVILNHDDGALRLSSRIQATGDRLGSIRSEDELEGLDVTLIDLTNVETGEGGGHFVGGTSPAVIDFVQYLERSGIQLFDDSNPGLLESGIVALQTGANELIRPQ